METEREVHMPTITTTGPRPEQLLQVEGHRRRPLMALGSGSFQRNNGLSRDHSPARNLEKKRTYVEQALRLKFREDEIK